MITTIGEHRVRCGNVMETAGVEELMAGEQADLFYSDPPWGDGNLKFWRTMNEKMTGRTGYVPPDLHAFLTQIFSLAKRFAKNTVIIDYGVKWEAPLIDMASTVAGLQHLGRATPVYGSTKLPCHTHVFQKSPHSMPAPDMTWADYFKRIDGTTAFTCVKLVVAPFAVPGGVYLDPCCGLGYGARVAMLHQMRFRGNELNSARLASTISRLRKGR